MNLRVADIQACYEQWSSKGAEFVTPPIDRGAGIRCYMRDPDAYVIEVSPLDCSNGIWPRSGPKICPAEATERRVCRADGADPLWPGIASPCRDASGECYGPSCDGPRDSAWAKPGCGDYP
jgi:hypothetical protein